MSVNSRFAYDLSKLSEECGELVQISMKTMIFGVDSVNPDNGVSNRDALKKEIGDVLASIQILSESLGYEFNQDFIDDRKEVLANYYLMSQMK